MPLIRCDRCRRRYRGQDGWNVVGDLGAIVGYLCPDCQTPYENAEAEIKAATLNYSRDSQGRVVTMMKTAIPELGEDEMQALTKSGRTDLSFELWEASDEDSGDEIAQVVFVVDNNGPLGYTPIGEPRPEPMILAALVEQHSEQYGR
jgi:hypothetical protein